jgi:hypothetical protein
MKNLAYILTIVGTVMVYGSGRILKLFKVENNIKAVIILKFAGLGVALIGILKILNVY